MNLKGKNIIKLFVYIKEKEVNPLSSLYKLKGKDWMIINSLVECWREERIPIFPERIDLKMMQEGFYQPLDYRWKKILHEALKRFDENK